MLFNDYFFNKGINSMRGATQLIYVAPGSPSMKGADNAKWLMEHVMYLPLHQMVPDADFYKTIKGTIEAYYELVKFLREP